MQKRGENGRFIPTGNPPKPRDRREYYRQYRLKNLERVQARMREYARSHAGEFRVYRKRYLDSLTPEQLEAKRKRTREYMAARREYNNERNRVYRERHHEEYNRRKREQMRARKAKRDPVARARELNQKAIQGARYGYSGKLTPGGI